MSSTAIRPSLRLWLLALACILSMTACKTTSSKLELPRLAPEAPEVRCKQPAAPVPPALPKKDEWVEWRPALQGPGTARLSEKAAAWVLGSLGAYQASEGLRKAEHDCLDKLQEKGLIRQ